MNAIRFSLVALAVVLTSACADSSMFRNRPMMTLDCSEMTVGSRWFGMYFGFDLTKEDAQMICEALRASKQQLPRSFTPIQNIKGGSNV